MLNTLSDKAMNAGPLQTLLYDSALMRMIYQCAVTPDSWANVRHLLLKHFLDDGRAHNFTQLRSIEHHIRRALRLRQKATSLQQERARLSNVLQNISPAMVVVDSKLGIRGMNERARSFLSNSPLLSVAGNTLHASIDILKAILITLVRQAQQRSDIRSYTFRGLDNESDQLLFCAIANQYSDSGVNLFVFDQLDGIAAAIKKWSEKYGLSPRETELLHQLVLSSDLNQIADRFGISVLTARQHLKNIFLKTSVENQSMLIAQVLQYIVIQQVRHDSLYQWRPHFDGMALTRTFHSSGNGQISFAEMGDPNGMPVLYFHSINSSRLEPLLCAPELSKAGVRLICPDRVGYGYSCYQERNEYQDYIADLIELLDYLKLDKVGVLSCSAGSPHALAFAQYCSKRVTQVHCMSAVPHPHHVKASSSPSAVNNTLNRFFRVVPSLMRPALELTLMGLTAERVIKEVGSGSRHDIFSYDPMDVAFIHQPDHFSYFVASMVESLRQDGRAWANENVLINRPWDIDPAAIEVPVHFWHGSDDAVVPVDMVQSLVPEISDGHFHLLPGETHMLMYRQLHRILPFFV